MTRNTSANKTIKGFYYQVLYASFHSLTISEGQRIACEITNSDFLIDRKSVEVKYYSQKLGWADNAVKNTIRNFIDLEKTNPGYYTFELLTSAESRNSQTLQWWDLVRNGDVSKLDSLKKELKILYISQITDEKAEEVKALIDSEYAEFDFGFDLLSFLSRVIFSFNCQINKTGLQNKIAEMAVQFLGQGTLVQNDTDAIMYCLMDRVWQSVISGSDSDLKYIKLQDIKDIFVNRELLIENVITQKHYADFKHEEQFYDLIREKFSDTDVFEGNKELEEQFLHQLDVVTEILLKRYSKEELFEFIYSIKRSRFIKENVQSVNIEDLEDVVTYLVLLTLGLVEEPLIRLELIKENLLRNVKINSNEFGLCKVKYYGSPRIKLINFIRDRFIKKPPLDLSEFNEKTLIILKDFENQGYFCNNDCDLYAVNAQEFLNNIVKDISNAGETEFKQNSETYDQNLSDYMCEYHCGFCCNFDGSETFAVNQARIRRLLKNA